MGKTSVENHLLQELFCHTAIIDFRYHGCSVQNKYILNVWLYSILKSKKYRLSLGIEQFPQEMVYIKSIIFRYSTHALGHGSCMHKARKSHAPTAFHSTESLEDVSCTFLSSKAGRWGPGSHGSVATETVLRKVSHWNVRRINKLIFFLCLLPIHFHHEIPLLKKIQLLTD